MLSLWARSDGGLRGGRASRREVLRLGAAAAFPLSLAQLARASTPARARSLILIALEGGPSHIDTWDLKPDAPAEVRGEFQPIATSLPGVHFCEHLPMLARHAHRLTIIRSAHHRIGDHNAGYYQAVSGADASPGGKLIVAPSPTNFPPIPAVLAKLRPPERGLPASVHAPDWMSNNGFLLPGQHAGFLGAQFDPLLSGDPSRREYKVPGLSLPENLTLERVARRENLRRLVDQAIDTQATAGIEDHYAHAFELLADSRARQAFELDREPPEVRERYGFDPDHPRDKEARLFGGIPHFGQCLLLARRLIEAGVRVVTVCSGARFDQTWDTHRQNFGLLERSILPYFDRALSALLDDLTARGLLGETLVVAMGEFGRTPRVGQITSDAGSDRAGRDHWPHCYSLFFAGGGAPGGYIHGASDKNGAYPARDAVTPADVVATIYALLGIDPTSHLHDPTQQRDVAISNGQTIRAITG